MSEKITRVPPNVKELENNIIGCMLLNSRVIDTVAGILTSESFYVTGNQIVFNAILSLNSRGRTPDEVSCMDELMKTGKLEAAGGAYHLTTFTAGVTSSHDIEGKCKRIQEKYILRELIRFGSDLVSNSYEHDSDAFDMLDYAETKIMDLSASNLNSEYSNLQSGMVAMVKKIEEMQHQNDDITGVPSGYSDLDDITHGWQGTDFIVLAARPSVGKSAFALNLARNAANHLSKPINVGLFSMEMSLNQLVQRIVSAESGVWLNKIKTGKMEQYLMDQLLNKGVMQLENAKIFIDDTAAVPISLLRSKARRMVMKDNVGLIIIDYLQLIEGDKSKNKGSNREQEISTISRELKKMAKQLKVPIIALAQLSREVEKRSVKTPVLSDLRESGAIEQDADIVGFLYRPSKEERAEDANAARMATLSIAKHRDGELVDIVFDVDDSTQKWVEVGKFAGAKAQSNFIPIGNSQPNRYESKQNDDAPF